MSFAAPLFLYALAAIAIPIIIHLFDLQRPKNVLFTNVKLLRNINEQTSSSRKLKDLLILISRILAIIFLVLAFSQPFIKGSKADSIIGTQSIGVYIDNSLSMQNNNGQKPLLEVARKTAEKLTDIFPPATQYYYLDNQFLAKDKKILSEENFKDRLTETNLSSTTRTLDNIYQKQKNTLEATASKAKKIFWLSDFQKSTVGNLSSLKIDSNFTLYLVPFQNDAISNVYVDSIWLENVFVKPNEKNTLKVKLKNSGYKNVNLHLKLTLDETQSGMANLEITPNSESIASFDFTVKDTILKKGTISFDDKPIVFDNTYYFTINVAASINIFLISNNAHSFIEKVFSNEAVFSLKTSSLTNISLNNLQNAQLIVVEEFDKLNPSSWPLLKAEIEKGKSIVLIPSESATIDQLNTFALAFNLPSMNLSTAYTSEISSIDNLKIPDLKNPFFANIFESADKNMAVPFAKPLINLGNKGLQLLQTKKDEALVTLFTHKKSKLYLFSTPLVDKFTNFHRHSIFVPFMYKTATQSASVNKNLDYDFNQKNVSIYAPQLSAKDKVTMVNGDFKYIPEQNISGDQLIFNIPQENSEAGFYDITIGDSTLTTIAINVPKTESKLDCFTPTEIKSIFSGKKNVVLYENAINDEFVDDFRSAHIGNPLWKYCLLLTLFFFLVEIVLIRLIK